MQAPVSISGNETPPALRLQTRSLVCLRTETAERAYRAAVVRGYDKSDINVLMSDDTRQQLLSENRQTDAVRDGKAAEATEEPAMSKSGLNSAPPRQPVDELSSTDISALMIPQR